VSRARNIKPGFFKNDLLAECDPLARILFAGLWCEADREGRLEDRPKRLKGEYLCYDNCDVDDLLDQLATRGFIVRYSVGERKYIQVLEFKKHQNPHVKESASTIPAPGEHSASPVLELVQTQCESGASTVQAGLIPDSPSLIPDSPSKDTGAPKRATRKRERKTFKAWMASLPDGAEAIPADHRVFRYAKEAGLPLEFIELAWIAFQRKFEHVAKTQADWPAHFHNAVEGNWARIWWPSDDGGYRLTTVGVQLERTLREAA